MQISMEERLQKLERENKILKISIFSFISLVALGGAYAIIDSRKYSALKNKGLEALERLSRKE